MLINGFYVVMYCLDAAAWLRFSRDGHRVQFASLQRFLMVLMVTNLGSCQFIYSYSYQFNSPMVTNSYHLVLVFVLCARNIGDYHGITITIAKYW